MSFSDCSEKSKCVYLPEISLKCLLKIHNQIKLTHKIQPSLARNTSSNEAKDRAVPQIKDTCKVAKNTPASHSAPLTPFDDRSRGAKVVYESTFVRCGV